MKLSIKSRGAPYFASMLAGLLLVPLLVLSASPVAGAAGPGASGLSISPLRQDLTLKPGQANKIDITLKNITGGPIIAKVNVQDFQSDDVTGNPKIITNPNDNSPASIRNFLIGLGNVPLATGEQTSFSIPVQAPANAAPGAYYGLVEYQAVPVSTTNPNGNNVVALSAAVSQLVFITVPGNVTQSLQINKIHIYHDKAGTNEGLFFTSVPKAAGVELHNFGNAFATPFGTVTLQNSEGKTIYSYELNGGITQGQMLPNSTRIFTNPLKNITRPGRYTLVADVSYGKGSTILVGKKTFFYIQTWLLVTLLVIILVLIGLALLAGRRYKRSTASHYRR